MDGLLDMPPLFRSDPWFEVKRTFLVGKLIRWIKGTWDDNKEIKHNYKETNKLQKTEKQLQGDKHYKETKHHNKETNKNKKKEAKTTRMQKDAKWLSTDTFL